MARTGHVEVIEKNTPWSRWCKIGDFRGGHGKVHMWFRRQWKVWMEWAKRNTVDRTSKTKTKRLEFDDEIPGNIAQGKEAGERQQFRKGSCFLSGQVVQWSKRMEVEEGCIFEMMPLRKVCGKHNRRRRKRKKTIRTDHRTTKAVEVCTAQFQYTFSTRAGCECIAHAL